MADEVDATDGEADDGAGRESGAETAKPEFNGLHALRGLGASGGSMDCLDRMHWVSLGGLEVSIERIMHITPRIILWPVKASGFLDQP